MTNVISVRFRRAGKTYFFSPGELEIKNGDHVIVETAGGIELGEVVVGPHEVDDALIAAPLKEVLRLATEDDVAHAEQMREREKTAMRQCKEKIQEHGLDMKLIACEYAFDNSRILFYFTSDGRVDFRDLVKELAGIFRTRIELRQVGVRDETKLLGGLGACGRPLCCATYLNDFAPVSIKMAKEQNLSLNPIKISGVCGRLMCCLNNEEEVYEELNKKLPGVGDLVNMTDGAHGIVQSVGILKQKVRVVVDLPGDEKEIREYPADEVTVAMRRRDRNRMREEAESREARANREERRRHESTGKENFRKENPGKENFRKENPGKENFRKENPGKGNAKPEDPEKESFGRQHHHYGHRKNDGRPSGQGPAAE